MTVIKGGVVMFPGRYNPFDFAILWFVIVQAAVKSEVGLRCKYRYSMRLETFVGFFVCSL